MPLRHRQIQKRSLYRCNTKPVNGDGAIAARRRCGSAADPECDQAVILPGTLPDWSPPASITVARRKCLLRA
jgi:hypothetical protein